MHAARAIYFEWSPARHLIDQPGHQHTPTHLGFDVGDQSAVIWVQETDRVMDAGGRWIRGRGLHVVDEWMPDQMSVAEIMRAVRERGWRLGAESVVCVDPKTRRDELAAIRAELPHVSIVKKRAGKDKAERVEYGHACVNVALKGADGVTRLTVHRGIGNHARGLVNSLPRYRRKPSGQPHRDDTVDHVADALRYAVAHLAPLARGGHVLLAGR